MIKRLLSSVLVVVLSTAAAFAGGRPYRVDVRVESVDSKDVRGIGVRLLQIRMSPRPGLELIESGTTDERGRVAFVVSPPDETTFYRVKAVAGDRETGSNPFRRKEGQSAVEIRLTLPTISFDVGKIVFLKDILLFEPEDRNVLRVTEIVHFGNDSDSVIDVTESPIVVKTPLRAKNVTVIQSPDRAAVEKGENELRLKAKLPPGQFQIVLGYDFATDGSDITFVHSLPPQLETLELLVPQDGITVDFERGSNTKIAERTKEFGNRLYLSKTLSLPGGGKTMELVLSGFPEPQWKMIVPAALLALFLFAGLGLHLWKGRTLPNRTRRSTERSRL